MGRGESGKGSDACSVSLRGRATRCIGTDLLEPSRNGRVREPRAREQLGVLAAAAALHAAPLEQLDEGLLEAAVAVGGRARRGGRLASERDELVKRHLERPACGDARDELSGERGARRLDESHLRKMGGRERVE